MKTLKTNLFLLLFSLGAVTANAQQGIRFILSGSSQPDTLHLHFTAAASPGYDPADHAFIPATGNGRNYIYTDAGSNGKLDINYTPGCDAGYSVQIGTFIQSPGFSDFKIEAEPSIPAGTLFALTDISSQTTYAISAGNPVQLYLLPNALNDAPQYVLHIFPAPVVNTTPAHCADSFDGDIHVQFGNSSDWIANIYDSGGFLVNQFFVAGSDTTFGGFPSDNYSVSLNENGLDYYSMNAGVSAPAPVIATFSVVSDSIATGQSVQIINNAETGNSYSWDFGDNSPAGSGMTPAHSFSNTGSYIITQTVTTPAGCSDYFGLKVDVYQGVPTGVANSSAQANITLITGNGQLNAHLDNTTGACTMEVFDMSGQLTGSQISDSGNFSLPVDHDGIYIVRISNATTSFFTKKVYVSSM